MQRSIAFFPLTLAALLLGFVVVVLGAYTRLSDAGLGCPDWPGCYGKLAVPEVAHEVLQANALYPERPLQQGKAWKEMVHRYAAGTLGLVILSLGLLAWKNRHAPGQPVKAPMLLLALVVFQAMLGMWTVTWLLKPIVVTAHLLGGMTILAILFWLLLGQFFHGPAAPGTQDRLLPWASFGIIVLALQMFLGGWTSANYAAVICPEFPTCRGGEWWPGPDFAEGFVFWRELGVDYEGGVLGAAARTAVHLAHRVGAMVTVLVLLGVAIRALFGQGRSARVIGCVILVLVCVQAVLGIANVLMVRPLPVAVAHNAVAALLLLSLVALLHSACVRRR
jgi:cytochrome c oxidase assembly protein subunit 15